MSAKLNGMKEHVGYMNKIFKTKKEAVEYYDLHNPHMRSLNAHNTWASDWDPDTRLIYVVRKYTGEIKKISPFENKNTTSS
jgi:hypothetical protein